MKAFRLLVIVISLFLWAVLLWLATHTSETPSFFGKYSKSYFALLVLFALICCLFSISSLGSVYARVDSILKNFFVVLLSVCISLFVLEVFVRSFDIYGVSYYEESRRLYLSLLANDELYKIHRAGTQEVFQSYEISINEIGIRDGPINQKGSNEFRIVFLGDSVTFGVGVPNSATFVRKLEVILQETANRRVRAINTGVTSYNTTMQLAFLRKYGDFLQPDAVALLYSMNDFDEPPKAPFVPMSEVSVSGKSPPQMIEYLLGRSWLYRLTHHMLRI